MAVYPCPTVLYSTCMYGTVLVLPVNVIVRAVYGVQVLSRLYHPAFERWVFGIASHSPISHFELSVANKCQFPILNFHCPAPSHPRFCALTQGQHVYGRVGLGSCWHHCPPSSRPITHLAAATPVPWGPPWTCSRAGGRPWVRRRDHSLVQSSRLNLVTGTVRYSTVRYGTVRCCTVWYHFLEDVGGHLDGRVRRKGRRGTTPRPLRLHTQWVTPALYRTWSTRTDSTPDGPVPVLTLPSSGIGVHPETGAVVTCPHP